MIDSAAYRSLSLHARAVLVELTARMNGYNNGQIAVSHRELRTALQCSPRAIVKAAAELIEHGILAVAADAKWKDNRAREYRLTFVSTRAAPATNDYVQWKPTRANKIATHAVAVGGLAATHAVAASPIAATDVVTVPFLSRRAAPKSAATDGVALIDIPYPVSDQRVVIPIIPDTPAPSGCERCGGPITFDKPARGKPKRFCTEQCRKAAELQRARERKQAQVHSHLKAVA